MDQLKNSVIGRVASALIYGHALWLALVATAAGIAAGYAAARDTLAPAVVLVLGLLAFAALFAVGTASLWLYERGKRRRLRDRAPAEIADQLFAWLRKYRLPAVASHENAEAEVEIDIAGPMPVKIVRVRDKSFITIVGVIDFEQDRRELLRSRALRVRHEMVEALNTQPGIEYILEAEENAEIAKVQVQCVLPFDETTREVDFLMAIRAVRATLLRVAAVWGRHLEEVRPGSSIALPTVPKRPTKPGRA